MKRTTGAGNFLRAGFAVLGLMIFGVGCVLKPAMPISPEYYLIGIPECKETDLISDLQIVQCASRVEEGLRQRYNNSRLARTEGGIIQVLTAGVSSMLTGIAGANGLTAGTILSGISAMMPEVSNVIEAKDRAEAYSDGMKSIGTALGVYRQSIAESHDGIMNSGTITPAGATLYTTLRSAVSVVESRLAGLLPTTKELMQARSELERFERIEVIPPELSLLREATANLTVVTGGPARAASGNNQIAAVKETADSNGTKFDVNAKGDCQWTRISLSNGTGGKQSVVVRVEPEPAFEVSAEPTDPGKKWKLTESRGCPIKSAKSLTKDIADVVTPIKPGEPVEITRGANVKGGTAKISLVSASGRSSTIEINVPEVAAPKQ